MPPTERSHLFNALRSSQLIVCLESSVCLENALQKPGARQCLNVVQAIAVANAAVIRVADVSPVATSPINVNVIVTEPRLVGA